MSKILVEQSMARITWEKCLLLKEKLHQIRCRVQYDTLFGKICQRLRLFRWALGTLWQWCHPCSHVEDVVWIEWSMCVNEASMSLVLRMSAYIGQYRKCCGLLQDCQWISWDVSALMSWLAIKWELKLRLWSECLRVQTVATCFFSAKFAQANLFVWVQASLGEG